MYVDVEKGHFPHHPSSSYTGKWIGLQKSHFEPLRRRSLWRWWHSLPRFQRCLFLLILSFSVVFVIYLFPSANKVSEKKDLNFSKKDRIFIDLPSELKDKPHKPLEKPVSIIKDDMGPKNPRQQAVVNAFLHGWNTYKKYAWGHDHLRPLSKSYQDWFGLGLTIIDSLDTMYIFGLEKELSEARDWVEKDFSLDTGKDVNLFEITIRVLGGLLSIYHFTEDEIYLNKAEELGNRLLPCFQTSSGIPYSDINLKTGIAHSPSWGQDSSVSEVTTIQLEFIDLSRVTGNPKYENTVVQVSEHLHNLPKKDGLVPMFINPDSGQLRASSTLTLGARADSYYEYLIKQWLQTGKRRDWLKEDFIQAVEGINKHLVRHSLPNKLLFIGELLSGRSYSPKMDHLVCFFPAVLALGYYNGLPKSHLELGTKLLETCYQMYAQMPTFLSPEIAYFNLRPEGTSDIIVKSNDAHNLLRPETVESLWYLYHLTGNKTYQEWGWQMFQAWEKYAKVEGGGYSSIGDVKNAERVRPRDMMETFFLGETLKYLYLLFSDDQEKFSLSKYVVNSEAHFFPIYNS